MKTKDKEKSLESSKREMLPYLQGKKKTNTNISSFKYSLGMKRKLRYSQRKENEDNLPPSDLP